MKNPRKWWLEQHDEIELIIPEEIEIENSYVPSREINTQLLNQWAEAYTDEMNLRSRIERLEQRLNKVIKLALPDIEIP